MSTPIVSYDRATMTALTESGCRYHIHGTPGTTNNNDYLLSSWLRSRGLTSNDVVDVSHLYCASNHDGR